MRSKLGKTLSLFLFCFLTFCPALAQTPQFVSFATAQPVLNALPNRVWKTTFISTGMTLSTTTGRTLTARFPGGYLLTNEALPGNAPSKLTDSLKTSVPIVKSPAITDYMYSYVRQK